MTDLISNHNVFRAIPGFACVLIKKNTMILNALRKGLKKNTSFYPHLVDKGEGEGRPMWISKRGGGLPMWIIYFYFYIIIKC